MKKICLAVIALALAGCVSESTETKLAKLESLRQEELAGIARQQGECNAIAIEFNGDRTMVENCRETYRQVVANAAKSISDIDKRVTELRRMECSTPNATITYLDCAPHAALFNPMR